ncbi:MAG: long-chain fatty acid--CoA ligase [Armatimonadetes bacterium]|nr:long-chain fatty acid--CoA ligase [Armatimonadota bacterium]NOG92259.1 long-chain fatty acid--CoA ligase [Armatimonadota bacterium]
MCRGKIVVAAKTLPEMLLTSCEKYAAKPAMLRRSGSGFEPITYAALEKMVHEYAAGLSANEVRAGDRVAIYSENSVEWAVLDWAVLSLGAITVPIYPTLLAEHVAYILRDSGAKMIFAGETKLAQRALEAVGDLSGSVVVVSMEQTVPGTYSLRAMVDDGKATPLSLETWKEGCLLVQPSDVATIIYTSGTTGEPKGVVLDHRAFVFQCDAIVKNLPVDSRDRFLSYLPLSHVYERTAGHFLPISCGAEIAYAGSLRTLAQDIITAKPTILLAVPRFLDSVRNKILAAVEQKGGLGKRLFAMTLSRAKARIANKLRPVGLFGGLLDSLVSSKVREKFGSRLRFCVSGGAALPAELAEFFGAFGILVLQGYGLTETAPVISVNHPDRNRYDSVGEILPGVEVRIADDGEILMRGPSRMIEYYNRPEDTAAAIDQEGWFHTGDIGRMEGNRLWITDRKKDIIVMANGKNVSPAAIENALKMSAYVEEAMALGDDQDYIAALIVPNFEVLKIVCQERGLGALEPHEMVEHPAFRDLFRQEIESINRRLPSHERVKKWALMADRWTQETGELTPTMKVKRKAVREKYAAIVDDLMERTKVSVD